VVHRGPARGRPVSEAAFGSEQGHEHGEAGEHNGLHPTEKQYLIVAAVLAVVTAVEVAIYYIKDLPDDALAGMLGILSIVKFALVVMYFMHLKFDRPIFRFFFITGLILAVGVYIAVLSAFHV